MTLPPLLRPSYWFAVNPPPFLLWVDRGLFALFLLLLVAGVIVRFVAMRHGMEKLMRRALNQASARLVISGCFGLLLYAMSYERIYVLGMRFGYVLWFALTAWYAWKTYVFVAREIPAMEGRRVARESYEKWLPKSKK